MTPDSNPTRTHATASDGPQTQTFDPAFEAGLAAAFGPDPTPGGWSQPPLLRDDPSENAPLVQPSSTEMPRGSSDRYQLLGEIARGGMGVILKGRDPDLGRDLAFKVLKAELTGKPAAEQRFVEEAQVGGQLQHPGVVPVYDLGRFADGRPYFAMKLVKGRTLADLLAERAEPSAERGRFLQTFLQICQTIAYAHAKGVIHRDMKPSNVMVGAFGEVLVMDWGLAKVLPRGGVADELKATQASLRSKAPVEEPTVIHTARAGSGGGSDTAAGSVMGTPAFMPPEQAGGEIDKLDERADVFGLGAVLCVILTGQPPYLADSGEAVRLMAIRGDLDDAFARLDVCGSDADLVELCKRCLAPKRDDRPRHSGEVASTVAEYLAAVEQRVQKAEIERSTAAAEAREQWKRRKVQAVLGSLVTLVVLIGGAAASWQWLRANRALTQVTAEKEKTADALAKVTEEQTRTFAALNAMTDEGIERLFQAQLEASDEQKAFVKTVTALYDQATQGSLDTPEGRARRADGDIRVGRLRSRIEDHTGAVENYKASLALLNPLCEEFRDNLTYRFHLAKARSYLGWTLAFWKRYPEAEAEIRAAMDSLQALVAADSANLDYLFELGYTQDTLGWALSQMGRQPEAIALSRAAIQSYRTASEHAPDNTAYSSYFLAACSSLANLLPANSAEKEKAAREAVAVADPMRQRHHRDVKIQVGYLRCHHNLVVALMGVNKHAAAEPEARLVREGWLDLATRYPSVSFYRSDLVSSQFNLASILTRLNHQSEAVEHDTAAVAGFQRLMVEVPTNREYRTNCIYCLIRLGNYQVSLQTITSHVEAETHYRAALKLIDERPAADRDDREFRRLSIEMHEAIGRVRNGRRLYAEATPEFRAALTQLESLMAEPPVDPALLRIRAQARFNLGNAFTALDNEAEALTIYRLSLADWEVLVRQDKKDFSARNMMARCHAAFATAHLRSLNYTKALAEHRVERDIRTSLVADSPTPQHRQALALAIQSTGHCLKNLGKHPASEKEFLAALTIFRELVIEFPKNRSYQLQLGIVLMLHGHALISQQRFSEVEKPAAEADRLFAELYKVASNDSMLRGGYAQNTGQLAAARAHTGDHNSASQLLGKMVALDPNSVENYYNAACVLGHCVLAVGRSPQLTDQQRKDLVNVYTDRALSYLRRAVELLPGATASEREELDRCFPTDKDLDPFRNHSEFKKILADLDKLPALAPPPRAAKR